MKLLLHGLGTVFAVASLSCLRSAVPDSLFPEDRDVILRGRIAGLPWSLSAYRKETGAVCSVIRVRDATEIRDEFGSCPLTLRGQPDGGNQFLNWFSLQPRVRGSVLAGMVSPQVASVRIYLEAGKVLRPRIVDAGYPLNFFAVTVAKPARQALFVALNQNGQVLEFSPKLKARWAVQALKRLRSG